jgi:ParB-like chromosome segregation protein Spo0J
MVAMKVHPLAELFPPLPEREMAELTAHIRALGLLEPIARLKGAVLDGRHRLRACQLAGVRPRFKDLPPKTDAVKYIIGKNLLRRHLSTAQRSMLAAQLATYDHGGNRRNQAANLRLEKKSVAEAAKLLDVSPRSVDAAKAIMRQGHFYLGFAVRNGLLPLSAATELTKLPREEQEALAAGGTAAMRAKAAELRREKIKLAAPAVAPVRERIRPLRPQPRDFDPLFLRDRMLDIAEKFRDDRFDVLGADLELKTFFANARKAHDPGIIAEAKQAAIDTLLARRGELRKKMKAVECALDWLGRLPDVAPELTVVGNTP